MDSKVFTLCIAVFLISVLENITCARIFCLFPTPSLSHQSVYRGYISELAKNSHQIVVAAPNYFNHSNANIQEIDLSYIKTIWNKNIDFNSMKRQNNFLSMYRKFVKFINESMEYVYTNQEIKRILNKEGELFDLFVVEFLGDISQALKNKLNIPSIGIISMDLHLPSHYSIGNYYHLQSFSDSHFSEILIPTSSFEKISYLLRLLLLSIDYFGEFEVLGQYDIDLVFVNAHPVLGNVMPVVPRYVDITGIHLQPLKPLPTEIQQFMDESEDGVILFCLGTNVKIENLNKDLKSSFMQAFSQMPYKVIIKEKLINPVLPEKIMSFPWLPQREILNHPNMKLFIFQGGYQSYVEAVTHAVPMLVIPFIGDQLLNAHKIDALKIGKRMDLNDINADTIKKNILHTIESKEYKENVQRLSMQLYDSPQTPQQRAVWWTEYVLRHNGTKQLQPLQPLLSIADLFHLDLIAILFFIFILLILVLKFVIIRVYRFIKKYFAKRNVKNKFD